MSDPVVTLIDEQGFPLPMRVRGTTLTSAGVHFDLPTGQPANLYGPAYLTFHSHLEKLTGQQNLVFTGHVEASGTFIIDRQVGDWSLVGNKLQAMWDFMNNGRKLAPRLKEEARRRG